MLCKTAASRREGGGGISTHRSVVGCGSRGLRLVRRLALTDASGLRERQLIEGVLMGAER